MMRWNLILIFLLISFGVGFYFGEQQCEICPPEEVDFSLFWEAWHVLEERFVDPEKIDYQKMIYGAISGMVQSLKDPYTIFMTPQETKLFKEEMIGEFEGVGMKIGIRDGELTIIAPLEGTPAQRAGLRAGDKIIKIDDVDARNLTLKEAVRLIRGPKGTEVILTIWREDWVRPREFRIIRDIIEIPSLRWEIKNDNIAYIKLYNFTEKTPSEFDKMAVEILNSPAQKIILDLRNNPGGYLEVAQHVAGWFLERGQVVVIEERGEERKEYKAKGNAKLLPYPLVVLINQGSASGSEILAGALRDNRGILLIGERTFGKGSIQELVKINRSSLKITIARWLTPHGQLIDGVGLEPDIKIEMTEEDYKMGRDPQLDKAIEVIKEMR